MVRAQKKNCRGSLIVLRDYLSGCNSEDYSDEISDGKKEQGIKN